MEYIFYDLFHDSSMQARLAGSDHTMGQDGSRYAFNIIRDNIESPMYGGISL